ncbi:hypothetical protein, partial [Flavobacterium sp. PL002]|uniref:hypothetical protein n=1 Tax=Flavobacterium sp. PL002 TaxID=1897058 RepID=UPI001CE40A34
KQIIKYTTVTLSGVEGPTKTNQTFTTISTTITLTPTTIILSGVEVQINKTQTFTTSPSLLK